MSDEPTLAEQLRERMARPQRHRLLQGYPAVPAMVPVGGSPMPRSHGGGTRGVRRLDGAFDDLAFQHARQFQAAPTVVDDANPDAGPHAEVYRRAAERRQAIVDSGDESEPAYLTIDERRRLIVGIIPHTQCVPRTEGCGFCTFPHDVANPTARRGMLEAVADSIAAITTRELHGRRVDALYIGGGTATLATPEALAHLIAVCQRSLKLDDAELSLEGTPALFTQWFSSHLKNWAKQPGRTRISMGVQTFDDGFLRLMGREKFGDEGTVKKIVKTCRNLGITTSTDFLCNLPGQTIAQMLHDIDVAVGAGLDQICVYHLVLYEGLGTPWSKDPAMLAGVVDNETAFAQWQQVRERLLGHGYVQRTLTNFEREDVAASSRSFAYEPLSFDVAGTDAVGFGPMSISTVVNLEQRRGLKLLRRKDIAHDAWSNQDLMYRYDDDALRRLFVVRGLAMTRLSGARYHQAFGTHLHEDFADALQVCADAHLLSVVDGDVVLTPRGMFFADAVVGMLAATPGGGAGVQTADLLRERPRSSEYLSMG